MSLRETVERLRKSRVAQDDPGDSVERWREDVSDLYRQVTEWLQPFTADGGIVLTRQPKTIHEEGLGEYETEQLDIEVGDETVRLDPRAMRVIGARGRIDISHLGSGDPAMLILTGTADDRTWNIVDRTDRTGLTPLTKDSFEAALDRLVQPFEPGSGPAM